MQWLDSIMELGHATMQYHDISGPGEMSFRQQLIGQMTPTLRSLSVRNSTLLAIITE
jgi:hypothetical protein